MISVMRKFSFFLFILIVSTNVIFAQKYEYKIITTIESVVPHGFGSSKMLSSSGATNLKGENMLSVDENNARNTTEKQDAKASTFDEIPLLNFYGIRGIRFNNIANNDAVVTSKLNTMAEEGWDLAFVNSGIESSGSRDDNAGFLITRYVFRRVKPIVK